MEVNESTIARWYKDRGFLMMRRRRLINRCWYTLWYSNDALIHAWELDQCRRQPDLDDQARRRKAQVKAGHIS